MHLKDVDPIVLGRLRDGTIGGFGAGIRQRLFTELGAGWLMVEQDSGWPPPAESAAIGRRVLAAALRRTAPLAGRAG